MGNTFLTMSQNLAAITTDKIDNIKNFAWWKAPQSQKTNDKLRITSAKFRQKTNEPNV